MGGKARKMRRKMASDHGIIAHIRRKQGAARPAPREREPAARLCRSAPFKGMRPDAEQPPRRGIQ
jgi:hypothetical protein